MTQYGDKVEGKGAILVGLILLIIGVGFSILGNSYKIPIGDYPYISYDQPYLWLALIGGILGTLGFILIIAGGLEYNSSTKAKLKAQGQSQYQYSFQQPYDDKNWYCQNCGQSNSSNLLFCVKCGQRKR